MSNFATGTISANDGTVGPVSVPRGKVCVLSVDLASGTITLQYSPNGTDWLNVEDGYTADTVKLAEGFGEYRLIGSGSPSAVCTLSVQ